ncbi:3115_t:CDS:2, partial [Racocetra fulgida]
MLFNGLLVAFNRAVGTYVPQISGKAVTGNDETDSLMDEKSSLYCASSYEKRKVPKIIKSSSGFLKSPMKRSWNSSVPNVSSTPIVAPLTPTPAPPLWKEQVDPNIKAELTQAEIHRQEIIFEIIRTEKAFVEDMKYLIDFQDSGIRLPSSLEQTFSILPDILLLHLNVSLTAISEIANARKKNNKLGQLVKSLESNLLPGRYLTLENHPSLVDLHDQMDCALKELQERKSRYERLKENDEFSGRVS